ncbi:MAG: hypothetical protein CMJ94_03180 [Planctomycetes bacterium]|nr:hypothetical protein [Planctomycetota bacterium]
MRARTLGRFALLLIAILLVVDVLRNLPGEAEPLGEGPAGFPWPTRGLGEISLGMEGRFLLDLEERIETGEGGSERVPQMSLAGTDPRPREGGMGLRDAVIRSFGEGERQGVVRVRVDAPEAWVPMSTAEDGTRELDRTRAWKFREPVVVLPGLDGAPDFVLETAEAELDPLSNEVYCPGEFVLRSAGLQFRGFGLRLTPDQDRVRFGETDGRLSWELELEQGGVLRGASDGGGELLAIADGEALLTVGALAECWLELPEASGLPGRLETRGFQLALRGAPEDAEANAEGEENAVGSWTPQHLDGEVETFWAGAAQVLLGGPSSVDWNPQGELLGLLIDGPILARSLEPEASWNTARGGAHNDAITGELSLWDRVVARTAQAAVYADLARVDAEGNLFADGELVVATAQGISFAQGLESSRLEESLWLSQVVGFPANAEVDRIEAPRMRADADQSAEIPERFTLHGSVDEQAWQFSGDRLRSRLDAGGRQVADARGGVRGTIGDAQWSGESLSLREGRFALKGAPCQVELPLESGGVAVGTAETATYAADTLRLHGAPRVRVPAASLGLAGDFVTIAARQVERAPDGAWVFDHDLRFTGAMRGTARRAEWYPDGRVRIERNREDEILVVDLEDGTTAWLHARVIEGYPDGPLELSSELDLRVLAPGEEHVAHILGRRAVFRTDGGTIEGPVTMKQGEREAAAQRVEWTGDLRLGPYVLDLYGNASFSAPEGSGKAHRMRYESEGDALQLFRGRRPAWLLLQGTRELTADWIRTILGERLIESRNGVVVPHQEASEADGGTPQ